MRTVHVETKAGLVEGTCDPKFDGVLAAFINNFENHDEVGASCAITLDGENRLDVWGGKRSVDGGAWTADTIGVVFSATKGAMCLTAHMAADRGLLDLDAPVASYWPEFAQNGKEDAIVSMTLDHSVGLPHVRTKLQAGDSLNYEKMVSIVEREAPFWRPGIRNGYHGLTMAWTVGEIVHRATKTRMGQYFQNEVAKPLGIDFWIGLPEQYDLRVAPMIFSRPDRTQPPTRIVKMALSDKDSAAHHFIFNSGGSSPNSREGLAAEIGSSNGVTNARGLAGMYAPLANGGGNLVGKDTLARMGRVAMATHEDATLAIPTRFSLGFMKSMDNRALDNSVACSCILSDAAFGHVGAGGSIGFADPECRMSFGYTMNRMGPGILLNERGQALVDAAYLVLGYRSNRSGVWVL